MKAFTVLILASIIVSIPVIVSPMLAYGEPLVGVKEGDWIEYDVSVTGTGTPPPTHDVRWFRMEILQVQGAAFSVDLTSRYANGTIGSAIWKFNFTEGNLGGWMIIPSNLAPGDTFYDSSMHNQKPVNVTIQRQEQKTVLGASRSVTFGNDSLRHKEWDKATGVFVASLEVIKNVTNREGWYIEDLTVNTQAIATNMWSYEYVSGANQTLFLGLVAAMMVPAVLVLSSAIFVARTKSKASLGLSYSAQRKIAVLTIITVVLVEIGVITMFPFHRVGLSFAEINLVIQTFWTGLVLASMWFRVKGNYFAHEITMLVVMSGSLLAFSAVLLMDPLSGGSMEVFSSTPLRLVMNSLHAIFSIPALGLGVWLVALWRPGSTSFVAKSRRIAQLTAIFWVLSYGVGVLDFMILHTTFFG